jgi:hypothetical protein
MDYGKDEEYFLPILDILMKNLNENKKEHSKKDIIINFKTLHYFLKKAQKKKVVDEKYNKYYIFFKVFLFIK